MTGPNPGGPEAADSVDRISLSGFFTPKKFEIITKVLSDLIELKLWFSPKILDCKGDMRLLFCL